MERRSVTPAHHAHLRGSKPLSTTARPSSITAGKGVAPRHEGLMLLNQDDHDILWRVAGIEIDASLYRHSPGIGMRRPAEALFDFLVFSPVPTPPRPRRTAE